jgi:hypothetical protein
VLSKILGGIVLVVAAISLWGVWQAHKANGSIEAANKRVLVANQAIERAMVLYKQLFSEETLGKFPSNRAEVVPKAKQAADLLTSAAQEYRAAADQLDVGRKTITDDTVAKYWEILATSFRQRADSKEQATAMLLLFTDPTVTTLDQFTAKINPLAEKIQKAAKDADASTAEANKIKTENASRFE